VCLVRQMSITTSLTLRALLSRAVSTAFLDKPAHVIAGLPPAAKALAAVVSARGGIGVTLLVVPTDKDVEQMTADARFFYAALEGASEAEVERAVVPLPSLQVDPYRGMTPHFRVSAARAMALHGAATGGARLIVASAAALLPRVSRPERLLSASLEIRSGTEIDPQNLADLLDRRHFSRRRCRTGPTRVCRRYGRIASTLRPVNTAVDRHDRSIAHRPRA
jgi:transcription-repair coupling factor (superfamily II helicase)